MTTEVSSQASKIAGAGPLARAANRALGLVCRAGAALVLCNLLSYSIFGFPVVRETPAPRDDTAQEIYLVIVLFGCMLLGMLAR